MEEKKSPKANLENKKLMFIQIGLIISLVLAWAVFEMKSYDKREIDESLLRQTEVLDEETDITDRDAAHKELTVSNGARWSDRVPRRRRSSRAVLTASRR